MDTQLQTLSQGIHVEVQEQKFENDTSRLEKIDYTHCFETINSNFQHNYNLHENLETGLRNTKQKVVENEGKLVNLYPYFENNDKIYIFENTDSNLQDYDNGDQDMLVEDINIKQEREDSQEQKSVLEDTDCYTDVKYDSEFENTELTVERIDQIIKSEKSDFESGNCYVENSNNDVANRCVNMYSKPENGATGIDKSGLKLENSGSCMYRCDDNITRSDFNTENIRNVELKFDKCDLKHGNADLNIEQCASRNESIDFIGERTDSGTTPLDSSVGKHRLETEVDIQPILMLKTLPAAVLNQGSQNYQITQTDLCHPKQSFLHMCNICGKQFKIISKLRRHMILHSTERPYKCNVCEKECKSVTDLRNHMISHSTERPHKCNMCEKGYKSMSRLNSHMISHSTERPHKCNKCVQGFKTMFDLKSHMTVHSTERPYTCNMCEKGYKTTANLRRHMAIHSTQCPHKCNMCEKGFNTMAGLRGHMTAHSSERPHKCNVCEKRFKQMTHLRDHMAVHSTERPHECNACEKRFKRMSCLRVHMIIHSTEVPHTCNMCEKGYKTLCKLLR